MESRTLSKRYIAYDSTEYKTGKAYTTYHKIVSGFVTLCIAHKSAGCNIHLDEPCFTDVK